MKKTRVIARLDVKGPNVIKGVHLECLRVVGQPSPMAEQYYLDGADELIYVDIVASLYGRQNLLNIVNQASDQIFIPFTVGGGVRTLEDIQAFLKAGADKVAINTTITQNPEFIKKAAKMFGSQCIVASIEAKKTMTGTWENYSDNGRQKTDLDVIEWVQKVESLGAGEILLTSIDQEGTQNGFDLELIQKVAEVTSIPVIACGGAGTIDHINDCLSNSGTDTVAISSVLHYNKLTVPQIKEGLAKQGVAVRLNGI